MNGPIKKVKYVKLVNFHDIYINKYFFFKLLVNSKNLFQMLKILLKDKLCISFLPLPNR